MSYLGKTPSQATRARYYFTATGGETSLSGSDDNGNTLVFTDGAYVDVNLNGVTLVAGTDYNTTTANTVSGLTALSASDVVEVVVYDTFSVFGGDVLGDFNIQNGTLTAETATLQNLSSTNSPLNISSSASDGSATLDASGRLLVGTTDTNPTITSDNGIAIQDDGRIFGHRGDWALSRSGDGAFMNFFESTGGSRSSVLGNIGISGGGLGISFDGGSNYLDDYEEGTWTCTITVDGNSGAGTNGDETPTYTKVGNVVTVNVIRRQSGFTSPTGAFTITGSLPFTPARGGVIIPASRALSTPACLKVNDSDTTIYTRSNLDMDYNDNNNEVTVGDSRSIKVLMFQFTYITSD